MGNELVIYDECTEFNEETWKRYLKRMKDLELETLLYKSDEPVITGKSKDDRMKASDSLESPK